jgi:poly-gamma-glutamate capsule biosynthesis protein CapA/YwtB (metallophosphatase superfamily)
MCDMRNALKALGAGLAVIALCAPLMFLPVEDTQPAILGFAAVTVTVPPTVVVATTIPGLETTTTTTERPPTPPPTVPAPSTTTTTAPTDIVIAAVGDVRAPEPILESVLDPQTGSYDFGPVFAPIAPYLAGADYAVAALEPRLAGPEVGYASGSIPNAPRELATALKSAGIDLVGTANVHSLDLGWDGITGTLDRLDLAGLAHVGTSRSTSERNAPVIADIKGIRVAFLDYTASVAGSLPADQKKDFAVNMLDLATVTHDAMTARSYGADAVVAMLNYGTEYQQEPSDQQKALSWDILRHGVDVIVGSHARVIQTIGHFLPYPTYVGSLANDKYVAYCLGDFLSAPETDTTASGSVTDSGVIAYLHFQKRGLRTYVTGVSYLPIYIQAATKDAGLAGATSTTGTSIGGGASTTVTTATSQEKVIAFRILPVLPGLDPNTDVPLTTDDRLGMAATGEKARSLLYRPDENISPLSPIQLGL